MISFDLKVGFSCCNNCQHCVITDKSHAGDVSTESLKKIMMQHSYADRIVITGGEATIRPDFIELLRFAKEDAKIPKVFLQSNGRAFHNKELAIAASKYLYSALIAIHSHNSVLHDLITQRKGSWNQTIQGAKNLLETNHVFVQSQTVISKLNCDNLPATYDFIYNELGIRGMNLTFPHPNGNAWKNYDRLIPRYESIRHSIDEILIKYKGSIYIEAIPRCYLHPIIEDVNLCEYDDLDREGFDASISKDGYIKDYKTLILSEHRKPKSCNSCEYNEQCIGVWKEYYEKNKSDIDLCPVKSNLIIPISVRAKNFKKFRKLFDSIKNIEPELIRNLIVFIDSSSSNKGDVLEIKRLSNKENFKYIELKSEREDKENFLLLTSLKFSRAISLSENILIKKPGMFHLIEKLLDKDESVICDFKNQLVAMRRVSPDIYFDVLHKKDNVHAIDSNLVSDFYEVLE